MKEKKGLIERIPTGIFLAIFDVLWVIGFITISSSSWFLSSKIYEGLIALKLNNFIAAPITAYCFINIYIIITGLLFRLIVPKLKEGSFKSIKSKQFISWRLNWHFYSFVFLFLSKYLYYSPTIRYIFLRLMRINLDYTTYFAETVDMQDANNMMKFGKNTGFGSEVLMATHLQMPNGKIVFGKLDIGDNVKISARVCIGPKTTIENDAHISFETLISYNVKIGQGTYIGANTIISPYTVIGKNCNIGHHVTIPSRSVIPDGTVIPEFSKWEKTTALHKN